MATKKISELEAINAAEDNDVLVIVDTSESTTNKITKGNLLIGAGHTIEMTLNENYQIVLVLKNAAGTALSTQTIDLPNENAVTNLAYNNGILTVTKQSGATSQINLMGLIEGLVTESDFNTFKEALQTTLEAINEKDAEQDEAIAENYKVINKLNEKLENQQKVIDQLPQVEGQGTSITLENTIEAQFTKFDVEGNSEQKTTTGKNLLNFDSFSSTLKDSLSTLRLVVSLGEQAQTVYTNNSQPIGKISFSFTPNSDYSKFVIKHNGSSQDIRANINFNFVSGTTYYMTLNITGNNPSVVGGFSFDKVMISTVEGDYEPYTGGIASPNPNYEQPIKSAGDNENIIDINRTLGTPSNTGYDNTNKRTFDVTTLIKFLTANNYYNAGVQIDYSLIDNGIKITTKQAGYGIGFPVILSSAKTYTISANIDVIDNQMIRAIFYKEDGTYISNVTSSGTNKFLTFTTTDDTYFVVIMLTPKANVETTYSKIKLEKGNKASGYSPYGMGSINEKILNKNLFVIKNYSKSGWIVTIDNPLKGMPTGDYTISCQNKSSINAGIRTYFSNEPSGAVIGNLFTDFQFGNTIMFRKDTLTQEQLNAKYLILYFNSANGSQSVLEDMQIMIEQGSTATSYVEHKEQDYPIFVQQPMRSNKDKTIKDKFVVKSDNKKYERHWIGEVVLNGTEEVYLYNDNGSRAVFYINVADLYDYTNSAETPELLSNRFRPVSQTATWEPGGIACRIGGRAIFFIFETGTTVNEFKNWLSTHNVVVQYLLAEPLDLPCTPEQVEQIENRPSTYKDFTIIQSQDETEAYLEVSGIRDINTMFDKVTNAIVSLGGNV